MPSDFFLFYKRRRLSKEKIKRVTNTQCEKESTAHYFRFVQSTSSLQIVCVCVFFIHFCLFSICACECVSLIIVIIRQTLILYNTNCLHFVSWRERKKVNKMNCLSSPSRCVRLFVRSFPLHLAHAMPTVSVRWSHVCDHRHICYKSVQIYIDKCVVFSDSALVIYYICARLFILVEQLFRHLHSLFPMI